MYFWISNWKTEEFEPNDSKHSLTSVWRLDTISVINGGSERQREVAREGRSRCNCGVERCLHASCLRVDCSAIGLNRATDLVTKYSFAFSSVYRMSVQVIQGVYKRMVRFQKLTGTLFLTLHGQNVHRQQRQLSKFLMRYQQFAFLA